MPEKIICPKCEYLIPLDDINVSTDLALCRNCGKTFSFSMLQEKGEMRRQSLARPPRNVRIEQHYPGRKMIIYKRIHPSVFFLIPFTALWSGFSMWGLYIQPLMQNPIRWEKMLFGIPFLIGTLILLSIILMSLLGKWVITLENGAGKVFVGAGLIGWTRTFNYGRDSLVSLKNSEISQNNTPMKGIYIKDSRGEILFGTSIRENCKLYIASLIAEEAEQV